MIATRDLVPESMKRTIEDKFSSLRVAKPDRGVQFAVVQSLKAPTLTFSFVKEGDDVGTRSSLLFDYATAGWYLMPGKRPIRQPLGMGFHFVKAVTKPVSHVDPMTGRNDTREVVVRGAHWAMNKSVEFHGKPVWYVGLRPGFENKVSAMLDGYQGEPEGKDDPFFDDDDDGSKWALFKKKVGEGYYDNVFRRPATDRTLSIALTHFLISERRPQDSPVLISPTEEVPPGAAVFGKMYRWNSLVRNPWVKSDIEYHWEEGKLPRNFMQDTYDKQQRLQEKTVSALEELTLLLRGQAGAVAGAGCPAISQRRLA